MKSFQNLSTVQVHLEFCLDPDYIFSESLALISHLSVSRKKKRKKNSLGPTRYLQWDRISRIPEIQRSVEAMEKEVQSFLLLCAVRQTLKKLFYVLIFPTAMTHKLSS